MADSFFGFGTTLPNLDDEGGGGPSEDEYDALNDETFGEADEYDWETAHEQFSGQMESSRRDQTTLDNSHDQLEASLSQLVLDDSDTPLSCTLNTSKVWQHDPNPTPFVSAPVLALKNVCTVEQLERQLRQTQQSQNLLQHHQQQQQHSQNFFQPRFPPVILQRPPGLQAPVPLPFAPPQQHINNPQMPQNINLTRMPNPMTQMTNQMSHMTNQMGQMANQLGQMPKQMGQVPNQMGQVQNQLGQVQNQMGQVQNQMGQVQNQIGQMMNQTGQNLNQINLQGQNQFINQMGQNNHLGLMGNLPRNVNQFIQTANINNQYQNTNQSHQMMQSNMGHNQLGANLMGQNQNQLPPNGNGPFGPNMNQFPHIMGQPRMLGPPPGLNMPQNQNFNLNNGQYNTNYRQQLKPNDIQHQQHQQQQQQSINKPNLFNQPANQSPPKNNQKGQKNRIIYNSNQKGMTSQNLVQLIQSTHPMLQQYNTVINNVNHHPLLNRNGVMNSGNQMYNRQNGGYVNNNGNIRPHNGEDQSLDKDGDEYAGLMTQREKQWLINIQMIQLNTGTPYMDDYYYTVFLERKSRQEKEGVKEAHKANQQNHPFYSGNVTQENQRERHNSARHNSQGEEMTPRTYVPTQFENSLGKLQCGSVTAPRKIIDAEVVASESSASLRPSRAPSVASTALEAPREVKRTKQLLLDIEALYLILLRLEELNEPLAISNALLLKEREEKARIAAAAAALEEAAADDIYEETNAFLRNIECLHRKHKEIPKQEVVVDKRQVVNLTVTQNPSLTAKNLLDENKDDLINKMFAGLLHEDRLQHILLTRKGRSLITRFIRRVPHGEARLRSVWSRVIRSLSALARHATTPLNVQQYFHMYISGSTGWNSVLECCSLLGETLDPARTPHALTATLTISIVCTLIEKASLLVNTAEATPQERHWTKFLRTFTRAVKNTTLTIARPAKPLEEKMLRFHIKHVESRSIEILPRGRTTADLVDLSKDEVADLLIRHLC